MSPLRPRTLRIARVLLEPKAEEAQGTPDAALEHACGLLYSRLSPWIGRDGCTRLLRRALVLSADTHPSLTGGTVSDADPHLGGLSGLSEAPAGREAAEAFLATVFCDLGRLVGDAVAVRVILPETPDLWELDEPADGDDR